MTGGAGFEKTKYPGVLVRTAEDGEEQFYIRYRNPEGKQLFEKAVIPRVTMTAAKAAGLRAARAEGKAPSNRERREQERAAKAAEAGQWTIEKLWNEYVKQRYGGKADLSDKSYYKTHLKDLFGSKEPHELVPLDVDRLRVRLLKTLSPGTVAKVLGLLRRLVNFGEKKRLAPGPGFKIALPRVNNTKTEFLTDEQMSRYIKVCREWSDPQAGNFQLLELFTGLRRAEARNLLWQDIDLERGFLTIRNPKGGIDQKIPLSSAAKALLEAHPRSEKSPYVFAGEKGGARGFKQVADASRDIRKAAGLPDTFRPNHGLRHSFASHLASSGEVDLYTIQRLLTHKSPMMTQRYAHLRDEALKRGADVMARITEEAEARSKKAGGGNG